MVPTYYVSGVDEHNGSSADLQSRIPEDQCNLARLSFHCGPQFQRDPEIRHFPATLAVPAALEIPDRRLPFRPLSPADRDFPRIQPHRELLNNTHTHNGTEIFIRATTTA